MNTNFKFIKSKETTKEATLDASKNEKSWKKIFIAILLQPVVNP